jgi:hypothetical protein
MGSPRLVSEHIQTQGFNCALSIASTMLASSSQKPAFTTELHDDFWGWSVGQGKQPSPSQSCF